MASISSRNMKNYRHAKSVSGSNSEQRHTSPLIKTKPSKQPTAKHKSPVVQ